MKTLVAIWVTVLISGAYAVITINKDINAMIVKPTTSQSTSSNLKVTQGDTTGSIYVNTNLQGGSIRAADINGSPALTTFQSTTQTQPSQGGSGDEYELQSADGYGALNWTLND